MSSKMPSSRFSKIIVSLILVMNISFTIAILCIFLQVEREPTTLIAAFFAFTTGELALLAGIKNKKASKEDFKRNESYSKRGEY